LRCRRRRAVVTEVVRTDTWKKYPVVAEIFARLNPELDNETMLALNAGARAGDGTHGGDTFL